MTMLRINWSMPGCRHVLVVGGENRLTGQADASIWRWRRSVIRLR
jgi:hypothetical protein